MAGREKRVVGNAKGQFAPRREPLRVGYGQSNIDGSGGWVRAKPADKINKIPPSNQSKPVNRQPQPEMKRMRAGNVATNVSQNKITGRSSNTRQVLEDAFRKNKKK